MNKTDTPTTVPLDGTVRPRVPKGVVAVLVGSDGCEIANAADFDKGNLAGFSRQEAQESRARRALALATMNALAEVLGLSLPGCAAIPAPYRERALAHLAEHAELPGFPVSTVAGHDGALWLGRLGAHRLAVMSGRKHVYETGDADGMKAPLRTLRNAGLAMVDRIPFLKRRLMSHAFGKAASVTSEERLK